MTVIAWDGKTLAADRLALTGYTRGTTTKIRRAGRELLAVTGDLSVGMEMLRWYEDGAVPGEFPASNRNPNEGGSLIVIRADGEVLKYESGPIPFPLLGLPLAFGSGGESAMVAMACGLDAVKAVEVVSRFNYTCGNGVDHLTLERA